MTTPALPPDFLQELLGEMPEAAYYAQQNRFGKGQNQRDYFQNRFNAIYNQYLGGLGQELGMGNTPTQTANQFFQNYDFDAAYGALAPETRGATVKRFTPFSKFLGF